jgi:hypothetical protein
MKTWAYLERVTSADQNAYLQSQVVAQFTSAAQRDSQWPTPPVGAVCYVQGTGLETYNGTAWVVQGTPRGIICSGPAVANPVQNTVLTLNNVIGGAASWLAANTITIPVGAGGLYLIALHVQKNGGTAQIMQTDLRDASNAVLQSIILGTGAVGTGSQANVGTWLRQCADGATFRVVEGYISITSATVVRLSLHRVGDALAAA